MFVICRSEDVYIDLPCKVYMKVSSENGRRALQGRDSVLSCYGSIILFSVFVVYFDQIRLRVAKSTSVF